MSDEETPVAETTQVTEPANAEPEKTYTKDQLTNAIKREVGKVVGKYEGKIAAMAKTETKPEAPPTPVDSTAPVSREEFEAFQADLAYNQALLGVGVPLTPKQQKVLRSEFDPANPGALKDSIAEIWPGQAAAGSTPTPEATPVVADAPSIATQYESAAPAAKPVEPAINPVEWTRADIDRMNAQGTFLENVEKYRNTLPGNATIFRKKAPKG